MLAFAAPQPTNLVTAVIGQLGELPPVASYLVIGYLLVRLLIPVLLIALAVRGATPTQRINLIRHYLAHSVEPGRQHAPGRPRRSPPPPRSARRE